MLTKSELWLLVLLALAFVAGGVAERLAARLRADGRGFFGGIVDEIEWAGAKVVASVRACADWAFRTIDQYVPVLSTSTGRNAIAAKLCTWGVFLAPFLPEKLRGVPLNPEIITGLLFLAASVWFFLRTLRGRRRARGPVKPRSEGGGLMGPGAAADHAAAARSKNGRV